MNRRLRRNALSIAVSAAVSAAVSVTALAAVLASPALAAAAPGAATTIESVARDALLDALAPALSARGATALATVAPPDARRAPAPCSQFIGFVPPGARLVGKTLVGVRCADGTWQTFVQADVRIDAPVWETTRALHMGESLMNGDVVLANAPMALADVDTAAAVARGGGGSSMRGLASLDGRNAAPLGRTVQRPVAAGRPLAAADLREEGRVNAGESVRIVYRGNGFSVASEGRTVGPADPGSNVQIRLVSGAVVSGTLRADHQVELPQ